MRNERSIVHLFLLLALMSALRKPDADVLWSWKWPISPRQALLLATSRLHGIFNWSLQMDPHTWIAVPITGRSRCEPVFQVSLCPQGATLGPTLQHNIRWHHFCSCPSIIFSSSYQFWEDHFFLNEMMLRRADFFWLVNQALLKQVLIPNMLGDLASLIFLIASIFSFILPKYESLIYIIKLWLCLLSGKTSNLMLMGAGQGLFRCFLTLFFYLSNWGISWRAQNSFERGWEMGWIWRTCPENMRILAQCLEPTYKLNMAVCVSVIPTLRRQEVGKFLGFMNQMF